MGTWGTGMTSNDTFCEVYERFFEYYNGDYEIEKISGILEKDFSETLSLQEVANEYWFALAKAQWDIGCMQDAVKEKVRSVVISEADLKLWKELGGTEKDIKARKQVLQKFLVKLDQVNKAPKKRKKTRVKTAIFKKGDCITFRLDDNYYGGAIILEDIVVDGKLGINYIARTILKTFNKPTANDFLETKVFFAERNIFDGQKFIDVNVPDLLWISPRGFSKCRDLFEVICKMKIIKNYDTKLGMYMAGYWEQLIEKTDEYFNKVAAGSEIRTEKITNFI